MIGGGQQEALRLLVDRNGSVIFPRLGSISVNGLTFDEATELIQVVKQQLVGTEAYVTMDRLRSINVFISGEVNVHGSYSISAMSTVSQCFISRAAFQISDHIERLRLKRGRTVGTFDIYDLLLGRDNSGDVKLQNNDVVFVPVAKILASIEGEIKRPAIYELKPRTSLEDFVKIAGGFKPISNINRIVLNRYNPQNPLPIIISKI